MTMVSAIALFAALILGGSSAAWVGETRTEDGVQYQCKCYADNACWPTGAEWTSFNRTLGGALQLALPPAVSCHNRFENYTFNTYDAAKCADATQKMSGSEQWMTDHPIAQLWPFMSNSTCLPTTDPTTPCTRGFMGVYVVLATKKEHIQSAVDFARERNLRLIIRNTGHDFMGRSTGYGALVVNTHSFKDVKFIKQYTGPGAWKGSAAVVGAGVQGRELYRHAFAQSPKQVIVGGECPTVGWGGGYVQGGGHGPLSGIYGMGADNVLSFDAITAEGKFVTANAKENSDLYWALKGGGPGTFAVVTSITVKTFPEVPTAGVTININSTHTNDTALFRTGFQIFNGQSNHLSNLGMFVYFEQGPGPRLHVAPIVGPNMGLTQLKAAVEPLFTQLDAAKVPYDTHFRAFPTFFEFYIDMFEDESPSAQSIVGGRLFTQRDIAENNEKVSDALLMAGDTGINIGHIVNPGVGTPVVDNAIHPKWRNASTFVITNVFMTGTEPWSVKKEREKYNTEVVGQALREAGPYGASYVNEGDLYEPDWQEAYWGSNYPRLLKIRQKWDPKGVFYTQTTPGTEKWNVIDYGRKLCKKA
ncbi:hypothetical protein C7974DRAFT_61788 [Boeremia exigua]|uniref:uncharacterized protein n=1 Tax=Boeremia exigua TaxID=749465 RepID=UPI001E8E6300|nr:uncharacterized protein C7974DRAFT_61788 [Boeremia exigua]KAH6615256.1 hypothetical protein C7974DRAFT_61788 [Boeremia exigua]